MCFLDLSEEYSGLNSVGSECEAKRSMETTSPEEIGSEAMEKHTWEMGH